MYRFCVITASDKGHAGERADLSGKFIREFLSEKGFSELKYIVLPDEYELLKDEFIHMSDNLHADLILTTGGTGFSKRDITPEATKAVIDRDVPGIPEAMRSYSLAITNRAMLSRAAAGIRGNTLIVNLPGSEKAVKESLIYIFEALIHGLDILTGAESDCAPKS